MSFHNLSSEAQFSSENMGVSERLQTSGVRAAFDHQKVGGGTLMDKKFVEQDGPYWTKINCGTPADLQSAQTGV